MNRIVMQFAGLWLGVSGAIGYAQWNAPTFGNTYRVAYATQDSVALPPAVDDAVMSAPAVEEQSVMSPESGMPMSAGPIGYDQAAYGNGAEAGYIGAGYGSEACCEPTNPCTAGLWDGYWSAKRHWCQKDCGNGCGHGLLPQLNWTGGCCSHRACFNGGGATGGCCGAGMGGHGLFGGHGHGCDSGCGCAEETVGCGDCGCEPNGHGCGLRLGNCLPQLNWVGGCCSHRACMSGGVAGGCCGAGGPGFVGHGHHGMGVMQSGCSSCGN